MPARKIDATKFIVGKFNHKHLQLLNFWKEGSPYKNVRYVVADGAIRSGKTISMIISFLLWSIQFEGKEFALIAKTMATLNRNLIKNFIRIANTYGLNPIRSKADGADRIIIGSNIYWLYEANNKLSAEKIQGITLQGSLLDEVALFPEEVIVQVLGRHSEDYAKVWMNCNPESPYHYVKTQIIDRLGTIDEDTKKEITGFRRTFYLEDNLNLSKDAIDEIIGSQHGVFKERNIYGKWVLAEGRIYDMFSKHPDVGFVVEPEERKYTDFYVCGDFGTQNAQTFLLMGKAEDKWYVIKEYYYSGRDKKRQKDPAEYVQDYLDEFIGDVKPRLIILDPSATPLKASFNKAGIYNLKNANNEVIPGISSVHKLFAEKKLFINSNCSNTIRELETYSWDLKAGQRGEDKPLKENDHCMDALRYFVHTMVAKNQTRIMDRSILFR